MNKSGLILKARYLSPAGTVYCAACRDSCAAGANAAYLWVAGTYYHNAMVYCLNCWNSRMNDDAFKQARLYNLVAVLVFEDCRVTSAQIFWKRQAAFRFVDLASALTVEEIQNYVRVLAGRYSGNGIKLRRYDGG